MPESTSSAPPKPPTGPLIVEDRPCRSCGYNLRGLHGGGRCPECGEAIVGAWKRPSVAPLGEMPPPFLYSIRVGLLLMVMSIPALVVGPPLLGMYVDARSLTMRPVNIAIAAAALAAALMWTAGGLLTLRPRPIGPAGGWAEWKRLRIAVASSLACASCAWGLQLLAVVSDTPLFSWVALPLFLAAVGGWVPLCFYLSNLANWAGDSHLFTRFRTIGVLLGSCGVAMILGGAVAYFDILGPLGLLRFFGGVGVLILIFATPYFALMLWRVARMVRWAQRNAREALARETRRLERLARQHEQLDAQHGKVFGPEADVDMQLYEQIERQNAAEERQRRSSPPASMPAAGRTHKVEPGGSRESDRDGRDPPLRLEEP